MARIKLEWQQQQQRLKQSAVHPPLPQSPVDTCPQPLLPMTSPALPQPTAPVSAPSKAAAVVCIDLTGDDDDCDSDEKDEPLGENALGQQHTLQIMDDAESDVDEAWPEQARAKTAEAKAAEQLQAHQSPVQEENRDVFFTSVDNALEKRQVDEDDEEEVDEALPVATDWVGRVVQPPTVKEEMKGEATQASYHKNANTSDAGEGVVIRDEPEGCVGVEDTIDQSTNANNSADPAPDTTTESMAINAVTTEDVPLEDGEIYEEGATVASPTQVKQAIAHELSLARNNDSGAAVKSTLRPKKQKKRGKKKSKRKLEAMMQMMPGTPPGFERNTRIRPPPPLPPFIPGAPDLRMIGVMDNRVMYGNNPPFDDHSAPQQRSLVHGAPLPRYDDEQILRVNRHGDVEMFDGEIPQFPPPPPPPPASAAPSLPMRGGFKYRSLDRPPRMDGQGFGGSLGSVPFEQKQDSGQTAGDNDSEIDLDSLRAAALRTKRITKSTSSANEIMPTEDPESDHQPSEPPSPQIDKLRAEILKSMKKRKSQSKQASSTSISGKDEQGSGENTNTDQKQTETVQEQLQESGSKSHVANAESDARIPAVDNLVSKLPAETKSLGSVSPTVATPTFRPLTASTQSVIIRVAPEDFLPNSKSGSGKGDSQSSNDVTNSMQAAIEEMRRKIAEREKSLQGNQSDSTLSSKSSSSTPSPTSSSTKNQKSVNMPISVTIGPSTGAELKKVVSERTSIPTTKPSMGGSNFRAAIEELKKKIAAKEEALRKSRAAVLTSISSATSTEPTMASHKENEASVLPKEQSVSTQTVKKSKSAAAVNDKEAAQESSLEVRSMTTDGVGIERADQSKSLKEYRADYQTCLAECDEAEGHVSRLNEMIAKLEKDILAIEARIGSTIDVS